MNFCILTSAKGPHPLEGKLTTSLPLPVALALPSFSSSFEFYQLVSMIDTSCIQGDVFLQTISVVVTIFRLERAVSP